MTVKILPLEHKHYIAHQYAHENVDTGSLAVAYGVSRRTIQRVLVEMEVARTPRSKNVTNPDAVWVDHSTTNNFPKESFFDKSVALFKRIVAKLFPSQQTNGHQQ